MKVELPEIAHLRGLGDPMFFSFNIQPKSNILISHAAIMGTFILPPERNMSLCSIDDDPRLPHFVDYMKRNMVKNVADVLDTLEREISQRRKELVELDRLIAEATKLAKGTT